MGPGSTASLTNRLDSMLLIALADYIILENDSGKHHIIFKIKFRSILKLI